MTPVLLILILVAIVFVRHFMLWKPMDVSYLYQNGPLKIGHRGSPMVAPENTKPSFLKAIESGLKAIEVDVLSTKDGKVVCSHNHDLERETDGHGYINEMVYSELSNVDAGVKFPEHSPCQLPLLNEVLDIVPDDILIDIEIKSERLLHVRTAQYVARIIKERDLYQRVMVSSFHPLVIGWIKLIDPKIPTAYIWDCEHVPEILRKPRFINLVHPDLLHPNAVLVSRAVVRLARRKGLKMNVWTVNNLPAMEWLLDLRVDGIISDFPELMHRAVNRFKGDGEFG